MIMKKQVKNEEIKRKKPVCFAKVFKFLENKLKIIQKNFKEIIIIIRNFLGKAISHDDHYTINTGGQRPKIGGN